MVRHFLAGFCEESGLPLKTVSSDALALLMVREWPGNVRELKHAVQKLAVLMEGEAITAQDVLMILDGVPGVKRVAPLTLREARRRFDRAFIVECLTAHGWQVEDTAQVLGLERAYLYKKIKDLGITLGGSDSQA